jgi:hypothetical protein
VRRFSDRAKIAVGIGLIVLALAAWVLLSGSPSPRPSEQPTMTVPLARFFVALGFGTIVLSVYYGWKVLQMHSWPSVPAHILKSEIESVGEQLRIRVRYQYVVDGQTFTSTRITLSDFWLASGGLAIRDIWRNRLGDNARAFYDPRDPNTAVLVRPGITLPLSLFVFGFFWLVGPLLFPPTR